MRPAEISKSRRTRHSKPQHHPNHRNTANMVDDARKPAGDANRLPTAKPTINIAKRGVFPSMHRALEFRPSMKPHPKSNAPGFLPRAAVTPTPREEIPIPTPAEEPASEPVPPPEPVPRAHDAYGDPFKTTCFDYKYAVHPHHQ